MKRVSIARPGSVVPAGVVPVPVSGTLCGLFGALSVRTNDALRVPDRDGVNVIDTLQVPPTATVTPAQPFSETVKSSVFGTAALLTKSGAVPVFVTVTSCGALGVPVSRAANVSDVGENATAGAEVPVDAVQPESDADAEVVPSLTVTRHVEEV
jgi:hypothetical protein